MHLSSVKISGFRNFKETTVALNKEALIVGPNDVGKTNFLYAIRMLLDPSIGAASLDLSDGDFYFDRLHGTRARNIEIVLTFSGAADKEAVISRLRGNVSESGQTVIVYRATLTPRDYTLLAGHDEENLNEIESRFYLKHMKLLYLNSVRDLAKHIRREKRRLLADARDARSDTEIASDTAKEAAISERLRMLNKDVASLHYVRDSLAPLNAELQELTTRKQESTLSLTAHSLDITAYVKSLDLCAESTGGQEVSLGGDGLKNQVSVALWKTRAQQDHDSIDEFLLYCIEEPEAHLHPHQQRQLARYVASGMSGQTLITSHSPHITAAYSPDGIVRLVPGESNGTRAASGGCSAIIQKHWQKLSHRMTVLPAEAFFANGVLLVEGPSEELLYRALATFMDLPLDKSNISILTVMGVDFSAYTAILDAMEIPWALRTDNDVSKTGKKTTKWQLAGINRALKLAGESETYAHRDEETAPSQLRNEWEAVTAKVNAAGVFLAKWDLEHDIAEVANGDLLSFTSKENIDDAIAYLQKRKGIRMAEFLEGHQGALDPISKSLIAAPLLWIWKECTPG